MKNPLFRFTLRPAYNTLIDASFDRQHSQLMQLIFTALDEHIEDLSQQHFLEHS